MIKLWDVLPADFRFEEPSQLVTFYRGDKLGKLTTGMTCSLESGDPLELVISAAQIGEDPLLDIIYSHNRRSVNSPLISLTNNPYVAQGFAKDPTETIYEVTVPAHRILREPAPHGLRGWPQDMEVFMVGAIYPEDISRIKLNNTIPAAVECDSLQLNPAGEWLSPDIL